MTEPLLAADDIQANIEPGFRMPFQKIVCLKVSDHLEKIIGLLLPLVTPMQEVMAFHEERISKAKQLHQFGTKSFRLMPTEKLWLNISIGRNLLQRLGIHQPGEADQSFNNGLFSQSVFLGDPDNPSAEGHASNWKVGTEKNQSDLLLIFASGSESFLETASENILNQLKGLGNSTIIYQENGSRLEDDTEHFGFKDGLSQPYIRGRVASGSFYNERLIKQGNDDPDQPEFAAPGKILIWPGQYIFGYPLQSTTDYREPVDPPALHSDPVLQNGSFLVFRRLKQKVKEFYSYTDDVSATLEKIDAGYKDKNMLRSKLVGRFRNGNTIMTAESPMDGMGQNHFNYLSPVPPVTLNSGQVVDNNISDPLAQRCPFFAHVRKVNPRDSSTNLGDGRKTLTLRIMRRGIPFGPPYNHQAVVKENDEERGLLFLSYQTSISGQFEILLNDWANSRINPEGGNGFDLLVGQNNNPDRERTAVLEVSGQPQKLSTMTDFIIPTGGEYMFTPSISLLKRLQKNPVK